MGKGILGEVRKCKSKSSGAIRAVKILNKERLGDEDGYMMNRFIHENEIITRLDHPNIMKIYELYEDQKRFYLVMEFCQGGDLFNEMINQKFSESEVS